MEESNSREIKTLGALFAGAFLGAATVMLLKPETRSKLELLLNDLVHKGRESLKSYSAGEPTENITRKIKQLSGKKSTHKKQSNDGS